MAYRARNSTGPRPPMSLSHSLSLLLCPLSPSPGCRHSWLPSHLFPSCFPSLPIRFVLLPLARISLFPPALPLLSFPLCPCLFLIRRSSNLFAPPLPRPLTLRPIADAFLFFFPRQPANSTRSRQAHCQSFASSSRVCFGF